MTSFPFQMMKIQTLTIVGVGLLGGSIGLAAKKRRLAEKVVGVGHRTATLETALQRGAIDEPTQELASAVKEAEIVVFCTPVQLIVDQVLQCAAHCPAGALLTDVGSTKAGIVSQLQGKLPNHVSFVGSHPLAGSEKRGPQHAEADLFAGRLTVVTPADGPARDSVAKTCEFWRALGSRVQTMSPQAHDRALAMTSHLPHLAAAALSGILPPELHELAATGFRDTTRISAGDPTLWLGIFQQNREAVLNALQLYLARLREFQTALEREDSTTINALLAQAKRVRDALGSGDSIS